MENQKSYKSWTVSDEVWEMVEEHIPKPKRESERYYKGKAGGGRKPLPSRQVFEGIMYVLRNGCMWKAVPKEYGASSSIHRYFQYWLEEGFFLQLWILGLNMYDDLEGIGWEWQSVDLGVRRVIKTKKSVGKNPTDRGKNGDKTECIN
jgi:transposase